MSSRPNCVFCNITQYHDRDAKIWYVDNDIMVIRNRLTWVPVMLLVMPKQHLDQFDMWSNGLMPRLGNIAVELGTAFAPGGFRILSNFGRDGLQSPEPRPPARHWRRVPWRIRLIKRGTKP